MVVTALTALTAHARADLPTIPIPALKPEWSHVISHPLLSMVALALDSRGNIVTASWASVTLPHHPKVSAIAVEVMKRSAQGRVIWSRLDFFSDELRADGVVPVEEYGTHAALLIDERDNIYLSASHQQNDLQGTSQQPYLRKMSPEGQTLWERRFGAGLAARNLITDQDLQFDPDGGIVLTLNNGFTDGFRMLRTDRRGNLLWAFTDASETSNWNRVRIGEGAIYVVGLNREQTPPLTFSAYAVKVALASGRRQWQRTLTPQQNGQLKDAVLAQNGVLYAAGAGSVPGSTGTQPTLFVLAPDGAVLATQTMAGVQFDAITLHAGVFYLSGDGASAPFLAAIRQRDLAVLWRRDSQSFGGDVVTNLSLRRLPNGHFVLTNQRMDIEAQFKDPDGDIRGLTEYFEEYSATGGFLTRTGFYGGYFDELAGQAWTQNAEVVMGQNGISDDDQRIWKYRF
jgi:outer membrane protein assembly factor BamB